MEELRFSEDHVWVRVEEDGLAWVGITAYAQEQLGDVVFVDLPEIGTEASQGDEIVAIESVKTTGEVATPISGTVVAVNEALTSAPETINDSPLDDGWLFRMEPSDLDEIANLMDEEAYQEFIDSL